MKNFTEKDATDLAMIARRAPLQNMDEASAVNNLLKRFVEFYESYKSSELLDDSAPGSKD